MGQALSTQDVVVVLEGVDSPALSALDDEVALERFPTAAEAGERLGAARAIVVRNATRVDAALLERATQLEVVARAGVGLDNIDLEATDAAGVVVVSAPGANAPAVAELALGLALSLARKVTELDRECREGAWRRAGGIELAGRTWGVVGLGATGRETARLAAAVGMRVGGFDPFVEEGKWPSGVARRTTLVELLEEADVVSVHTPLTSATAGLIGPAALAAMRPGAFLVNVARGGVVDEDALADALESGHLGGAALDVRSNEPPVPGRLEKLRTVVLTPHVAGLTAEAQDRIGAMLADDIRRVLGGKEASHPAGQVRRARQR